MSRGSGRGRRVRGKIGKSSKNVDFLSVQATLEFYFFTFLQKIPFGPPLGIFFRFSTDFRGYNADQLLQWDLLLYKNYQPNTCKIIYCQILKIFGKVNLKFRKNGFSGESYRVNCQNFSAMGISNAPEFSIQTFLNRCKNIFTLLMIFYQWGTPFNRISIFPSKSFGKSRKTDFAVILGGWKLNL